MNDAIFSTGAARFRQPLTLYILVAQAAGERGIPRQNLDQPDWKIAMLIRKLDPSQFEDAYDVKEQMFYPWNDVVETPFGFHVVLRTR